eukprot:Blabericola_migrator_1__1939@NODE_1528_length_4336_cov_126_766222_g1004_i0_p3_GENE_NODE_1528_length_4336_cov_126_766222_g1004_i0NODE_1528_length_4336_cov_126_766222_g1004_i0_p3_ORF_typecomplete_len264_score67_33zfPARP/PF00645_18/1_8e16zfPARP/PF00645_18/2_5e03PADR1/PF08063_12/6_4e03PADR1/PF08063_12/2_7e14SAP/PF02037_27/0_0012BUD22/PF09073_10/0_003TF_Zn_Ribbon/PF08271_12/1_8e03TF_Zn_Ribbon/PF08271_12/0_061Zn_Tnp_IS1595/PF12760_7/47Zn_Tnp_IS1595/PF12760_7/0_73Uteroglobin/PF01099_17/2_5e03Uteroglobi
MAAFLWFIEKAKSGRSKCKGCQQVIAKDALRIGVKAEASGVEDSKVKAMAEAFKWYHFNVDCVKNFRKQSNWWKTKTPEIDEFDGLDALDDTASEDLANMLEALRGEGVSRKRVSAEGEGDGSDEEASPSPSPAESPKKQRRTVPEPTEDYNCPTLSEEQNEEIRQHINTLKTKTKAQLVTMLKENEQKTSGKKDELIERCAEGMVLGGLPICPTCEKAKVAFNKNTGEYHCPGSFDNGVHKCSFKSFQVQRKEWNGEEEEET